MNDSLKFKLICGENVSQPTRSNDYLGCSWRDLICQIETIFVQHNMSHYRAHSTRIKVQNLSKRLKKDPYKFYLNEITSIRNGRSNIIKRDNGHYPLSNKESFPFLQCLRGFGSPNTSLASLYFDMLLIGLRSGATLDDQAFVFEGDDTFSIGEIIRPVTEIKYDPSKGVAMIDVDLEKRFYFSYIDEKTMTIKEKK